jgi:biopolymer transport protein ExbB
VRYSFVRWMGIALHSAALLCLAAPTLSPAQTAAPAATAPATTTAAPAPAAPAAPAAASNGNKAEGIENPYGIEALWKTSDAVAKTVLILLLVMSASSWYVTVVKLLEQSKTARQAKTAAQEFWNAGSVEQGAKKLEPSSPFRFIADSALNAIRKHDGLKGHIPLADWVSMSIQRAMDRVQSNAQRGLAVLATVGSISPFVGLFGTVWGIYHALTAIGISGQASIDKVAGPVGEALIMTAIGLAVAVPAVLGYNWLVRRNKVVLDDVRAFGQDLHAVIVAEVAQKK